MTHTHTTYGLPDREFTLSLPAAKMRCCAARLYGAAAGAGTAWGRSYYTSRYWSSKEQVRAKMERFLRKSCVASLAAAPMPAGGATAQQAKKRARQLGVPFEGLPGPANAITDVPGVLVGHATLTDGAGGNAVRTGVTAVLPRGHRDSTCFAGIFSLNGAGEMTGSQWVDESGMLYGPVMITNTHSVGVVRDATVKWQKRFHPGSWFGLPVVGETFDGFLSDIDGHHVREEHAWAAIESAKAGPVEEGCVGGGTGMLTARFKGGIGTSSRTVQSGSSDTFTVGKTKTHRSVVAWFEPSLMCLGPANNPPTRLWPGVLVQSNYGGREEFRMAGVPVGAEMAGELMPIQAPEPVDSSSIPPREGSIIIVVATDAPLLPHQLTRLARRAGMGLARTGSYAGNSSGDIFIAFSTANESTLEMTAGTGGARGGGTGPSSGSVVSHVDFIPGEHVRSLVRTPCWNRRVHRSVVRLRDRHPCRSASS